MDWIITQEGYCKEEAATLGNRFLIGNGYIGVRGTVEEAEKDQLPAVNLAGIYDRSSGWREPVNLPNGCYSYLRVDGKTMELDESSVKSHKVQLDFRHGVLHRTTVFATERGDVTLHTERFADMVTKHCIGMRFTIGASFHADIELVTGVDCDVWDLNGPHRTDLQMKEQKEILLVAFETYEEKIPIAVGEKILSEYPMERKVEIRDNKILHRLFFITKPNEKCVIEKWIQIATGKEIKDPCEEVGKQLTAKKANDYQTVEEQHRKAWEELWKHSEVIIKGDDKAMQALNYSLYHLHSIAPRHTTSLSIPARGLSGQTYKGAVFWDTEMFMLDFFLFTDPATAKTLLKYRIDTLEGAKTKAASYGYEGAFYAWESQEGGYDACSDYNVTDVFTGRPMRTFFKDKQVHISAAIVYGIFRYVEWTGDRSILDADGIRTIVECAKFYCSLLTRRFGKDVYDICDVIGPDEYHERVNNNGYTNRMAKFTLDKASGLLQEMENEACLPDEYKGTDLWKIFREAADKLYIPQPYEDSKHQKVVEQFDGYFQLEDASLEEVRGRLLHEKEYWGGAYGVASHTQIIKQADVVTWLNLFSSEYSTDVLKANWKYYEPRTEHGSSLSAGMYAMLACKIGMPERAYPFFMKSALADLRGGGKEWAGLVYIGGTHPAAAGAAYMTAIEGFAGLCVKNGELSCEPNLPPQMEEMEFHVFYRQQEYKICIRDKNAVIKLI